MELSNLSPRDRLFVLVKEFDRRGSEIGELRAQLDAVKKIAKDALDADTDLVWDSEDYKTRHLFTREGLLAIWRELQD